MLFIPSEIITLKQNIEVVICAKSIVCRKFRGERGNVIHIAAFAETDFGYGGRKKDDPSEKNPGFFYKPG